MEVKKLRISAFTTIICYRAFHLDDLLCNAIVDCQLTILGRDMTESSLLSPFASCRVVKRMSPAERRHGEGHLTTGQRQRANSNDVAQTDNGNHQTTNDEADDRSSTLRRLHLVEGQDKGTPANCRTQRRSEAPQGLHSFPQCRVSRLLFSSLTIHRLRRYLATPRSSQRDSDSLIRRAASLMIRGCETNRYPNCGRYFSMIASMSRNKVGPYFG